VERHQLSFQLLCAWVGCNDDPPRAQHDLLQAEEEEKELILDVLVMMMTVLCCPHLSELSLHILTRRALQHLGPRVLQGNNHGFLVRNGS